MGERLDDSELATIRTVFAEGLELSKEGFLTRKAFVKAFTNSEECTLQELADLFDNETSASPCMALFDTNAHMRRRMSRSSSSDQGPEPVRQSPMAHAVRTISGLRSISEAEVRISQEAVILDMEGSEPLQSTKS